VPLDFANAAACDAFFDALDDVYVETETACVASLAAALAVAARRGVDSFAAWNYECADLASECGEIHGERLAFATFRDDVRSKSAAAYAPLARCLLALHGVWFVSRSRLVLSLHVLGRAHIVKLGALANELIELVT
jgi:hypothetical protein